MNSLVVLLSVVAFAAAKPSGQLLGAVSYSAPIIATLPSAVSSQSRVDIKSSPAVVSTAAFAPISRTIIAEPTLYSAPAAVSSQSRIDIKSSPAITTTSVIGGAPLAYSAPTLVKTGLSVPALSTYSLPSITTTAIGNTAIAAPAISAYAAPAISSYGVSGISSYGVPAISSYGVPAIASYGAPAISAYAAPAISAYGASAISAYGAPVLTTSAIGGSTLFKSAALQSAVIEGPSVPLDTPEVIAARAAHLEAKVLADAHLIKKRSVVGSHLLSTPLVSTYAATAPILSTYAAGPLTYSTVLSHQTPLLTKTYGVRAW